MSDRPAYRVMRAPHVGDGSIGAVLIFTVICAAGGSIFIGALIIAVFRRHGVDVNPWKAGGVAGAVIGLVWSINIYVGDARQQRRRIQNSLDTILENIKRTTDGVRDAHERIFNLAACAQQQFRARRFREFWETIDEAGRTLDAIDRGWQECERLAKDYTLVLSSIEHTYPSVSTLFAEYPAAVNVTESVRMIGRVGDAAERDFQFASLQPGRTSIAKIHRWVHTTPTAR